MKTYLLLTFFFGAFFPLHVFAQDNREDTIYMKDGNIFTGKVSEQVRGVSYRIERAGGSILTVEACDIKKIKKRNGPSDFKYIHPRCKNTTVFPYKNQGFFGQAQLAFGYRLGGVKAITGYKFHRFAQIGVCVGVEFAGSIYEKDFDLAAGYAPVCFYYSGDILKKQFTPFYALEFGYAAFLQTRQNVSDEYGHHYRHGTGGLTGGIGIGYRYYSWNGRFTCSLSVNADFIHSSVHEWGTYFGYAGVPSSDYNNIYSGTSYIIGMKFSIGF